MSASGLLPVTLASGVSGSAAQADTNLLPLQPGAVDGALCVLKQFALSGNFIAVRILDKIFDEQLGLGDTCDRVLCKFLCEWCGARDEVELKRRQCLRYLLNSPLSLSDIAKVLDVLATAEEKKSAKRQYEINFLETLDQSNSLNLEKLEAEYELKVENCLLRHYFLLGYTLMVITGFFQFFSIGFLLFGPIVPLEMPCVISNNQMVQMSGAHSERIKFVNGGYNASHKIYGISELHSNQNIKCTGGFTSNYSSYLVPVCGFMSVIFGSMKNWLDFYKLQKETELKTKSPKLKQFFHLKSQLDKAPFLMEAGRMWCLMKVVAGAIIPEIGNPVGQPQSYRALGVDWDNDTRKLLNVRDFTEFKECLLGLIPE